ncbi:hypothetical protein COT42_05720 [Candidatus Saganbacteria bacterium CG08_land_8_20_14_0_20_45_16]|uniref:Uncharacterized protein n=1 Tax=Candidatus Saganbacteria bacterium CG08_land_8_20_14_0_20_45_16 TaxID=2014293 RepID=A0A2H0XYT7_UNCSA|nr:MAG: hypothetical protein COT42_05720 [Candidatus Saganbacteria bacterium CG08_land_8_20_14_0_20_45_16]
MKKISALFVLVLFVLSTAGLALDLSSLKVNGDFRARYTMNQNATNDTFTVARARIKISGNVTDDLFVVVQPDFAGLSLATPAVTLADAYGQLNMGAIKVRAGQFLVPFAYDSGAYKTIIYPSHYNVIVADRDFGMALLGKVSEASFMASLTNGNRSGQDSNKSKDIAARVILPTPVAEVGVSGYYGTGSTATTLQSYGAYLKSAIAQNDVIAEYVGGDSWGGTPGISTKISNAYLQISKKIGDLEPLVQYEIYDVDTSVANNAVNTLTVGLNKYLDEKSRLMINYNMIGEETVSVDNNTLVLQARVVI